jgi:hypothetical protein
MTHFFVRQLRFTRSEFIRCLEGVSEEDGMQRVLPMNCLSWIVGHLASQENYYWNIMAQGKDLAPGINNLVGFGKPASTPPLAEMWGIWRTVTASADLYLDQLQSAVLTTHFEFRGKPVPENVATMLFRNIYHYWYHMGEAAGVRQALGHTDLPAFVGDFKEARFDQGDL